MAKHGETGTPAQPVQSYKFKHDPRRGTSTKPYTPPTDKMPRSMGDGSTEKR